MKLLSHPLVLAVLALVLHVGLSTLFVWKKLSAWQPPAKPVVKVAERQTWDYWTKEIDQLSADLKAEKEKLKRRESDLALRESQLAAERAELDKLRRDIERFRAEIGQRLVEVSAAETKNLRSLAQTYSALTPKAAVAIFREMDDVTLVKILSFMKADVVGPLFEEMSKDESNDRALPRRAAALSEKLRLFQAPKAASGDGSAP